MSKLQKTPWTISDTFTLFDDESVKKKLTVMDKYEAMVDDARNPIVSQEKLDELNDFLQLGKSYKLTTTVEEIGN